jgi:hypothetical protein
MYQTLVQLNPIQSLLFNPPNGVKMHSQNNLHKVKHSNIYSFHYTANIDKYQLNKQAALKNVRQKNTDVTTVHL